MYAIFLVVEKMQAANLRSNAISKIDLAGKNTNIKICSTKVSENKFQEKLYFDISSFFRSGQGPGYLGGGKCNASLCVLYLSNRIIILVYNLSILKYHINDKNVWKKLMFVEQIKVQWNKNFFIKCDFTTLLVQEPCIQEFYLFICKL